MDILHFGRLESAVGIGGEAKGTMTDCLPSVIPELLYEVLQYLWTRLHDALGVRIVRVGFEKGGTP